MSVNGKRVPGPVQAGTFAAIRRIWKNGDRAELEIPMPLRLEAVDEQNPNLVALLRGPLVLFAISDSRPVFDKSELLRTQELNNGNGDCVASAINGNKVVMRPFMNIGNESYNTYVTLKT